MNMQMNLDSLNERMPIKWLEKSFKENNIFSMQRDSRFYPQIISISVFLIGQVPIKEIWVENSVFAI